MFIWFYPKLEVIFGLSSIGKQFGIVSKLISFTLKAYFVVFYPIACSRYLSFFTRSDSRATTYARNLTFVFNWVLLATIYMNELSFQGLAVLMGMFKFLINSQSPMKNLNLLLKCTLKALILGIFLIKLNYSKYTLRKNKNLRLEDEYLMFFLLLPFFVMIFAANRINIGNTVVKHFLLAFEDNQLDQKTFGAEYGQLHDFFISFNKSNSMNFLAILCFCILNIVYEVVTM